MNKASTKTKTKKGKVASKRRAAKAKELDEEALLQNLSIKHKEEAITVWYCTNGFLDGQKVSRDELCKKLGLSEYRVFQILENVKNKFSKMFQTRENIRDTVFSIVNKLVRQLHEDRERITGSADDINKRLIEVDDKEADAMLLGRGSHIEASHKDRTLSRLSRDRKWLIEERQNCLKLLLQSTDSLTKVVGLFSGKNQNNANGIAINFGFIGTDESQGNFVNYKEAIEIIETNIGNVLPSQSHKGLHSGPKNPNAAFEELKINPQDIH